MHRIPIDGDGCLTRSRIFPVVFINRSSSLPTIIEILMFWLNAMKWKRVTDERSNKRKNEWKKGEEKQRTITPIEYQIETNKTQL